ncbi:hypothetical protein C8P68_1113 [Mucilaginibacter yixingensis]|uniref:Uncharacterized protein n=1 Tax=Mucilaginibacter yixingensis TaxID=1295612 RepID=A0A2T5J4N0_9SPHI|nr:hypothetical protein [Mucilaginibacter yixingensis]PTQ92627.1 hypothetical protein C8P68_1113 [Mucilaginibacter yixingensis]
MKLKTIITLLITGLLIAFGYYFYKIKNQYVGVYIGKNTTDTLLIIKSNGTGYSYKHVNTTDLIIPKGSFKWHINDSSKYHAIMFNWDNIDEGAQFRTVNLLTSAILGVNLPVKDTFSNTLFFSYKDLTSGQFKMGIYGTKNE